MRPGNIYMICRVLLLLFSPAIALPQTLPDTARCSPYTISLPGQQIKVTSGFGWRIHPVTGKPDLHQGVDLAARNDPVYSIMAGTVYKIGSHPILGRYIRIDHGVVQSIYEHLSAILVQAGQSVNAGQPIGITGSTGRATGEHLHFSIRSAKNYIHPLQFLEAVM